MREIKLYKSVKQGLKLILLCSVFVIPGTFMVLETTDADHWVGWLAICIFGIGYPFGLYLVFDRRPAIVINETGIMCRTYDRRFINWDTITHAYLSEAGNQQLICLALKDGFDPFPDKGKLYRQLAEINVSLGFQKINLPVSNIRVNAEALLDLITALVNADHSTRANIIVLEQGRGSMTVAKCNKKDGNNR